MDYARRETPATPDARRETADARRETADVRRETADVRRQTADGRRETADVRRETADARRETADVRRQTADARRETADARRETPDRLQKDFMDSAKCAILETMRVLIFLLFSVIQASAQSNYGTIDQGLLKGVVHIVKGRSIGTGFLLKNQQPDDIPRTFLITNKHMIGHWSLCESLSPSRYIDVTFYLNDSTQLFRSMRIEITNVDGQLLKNVQPHPSQQVDVAMIEITEYLVPDMTGIYTFDTEDLKPLDAMFELKVGLGDAVFALGYPSDIRSLSTNLPIAKAAYISSGLEGNMKLNVSATRRDSSWCRSQISGKIFLVDGNIIGGNSGGPIVTGRQSVTRSGGASSSGQMQMKNVVIGVVSQGIARTGINIIYGCDYIFELLSFYRQFKLDCNC